MPKLPATASTSTSLLSVEAEIGVSVMLQNCAKNVAPSIMPVRSFFTLATLFSVILVPFAKVKVVLGPGYMYL